MLRQYKPANQCIYCGRTDEPLTKEHIIPFSLGGTLVLRHASCIVHSNLTSKLEKVVSQQMYGIYRDVENVPTRHKQRKKFRVNGKIDIPAIGFDGTSYEIAVRVPDMPRIHIVPSLPVPQFLTGEAITGGAVGCELRNEHDPEQMQKVLQKFNVKSLQFEASMQAETFMRVLAKIGHAFAAAEYGSLGFTPTLLPVIEGKSLHVKQFIGGFSPQARQNKLPLEVKEVSLGGKMYVIVELSLHALPRLPRYQIIAGYR